MYLKVSFLLFLTILHSSFSFAYQFETKGLDHDVIGELLDNMELGKRLEHLPGLLSNDFARQLKSTGQFDEGDITALKALIKQEFNVELIEDEIYYSLDLALNNKDILFLLEWHRSPGAQIISSRQADSLSGGGIAEIKNNLSQLLKNKKEVALAKKINSLSNSDRLYSAFLKANENAIKDIYSANNLKLNKARAPARSKDMLTAFTAHSLHHIDRETRKSYAEFLESDKAKKANKSIVDAFISAYKDSIRDLTKRLSVEISKLLHEKHKP